MARYGVSCLDRERGNTLLATLLQLHPLSPCGASSDFVCEGKQGPVTGLAALRNGLVPVININLQ
jgi:hypothetical protein